MISHHHYYLKTEKMQTKHGLEVTEPICHIHLFHYFMIYLKIETVEHVHLKNFK